MIPKTFPIARFIVYIVLSLGDLVLTGMLLRYGDGNFYESNPIAGAWLAQFGFTGLLVFKAVAVLLVGTAAVLISRHRPQLGGHILTFACVVGVGVIWYSLYLLDLHFK